MEPVRRPTTSALVTKVDGTRTRVRPDVLVTEEPMEIRIAAPGVDPVSVSVTMRTPGSDFELAVGFLYTEGLISRRDVTSIRYCDLADEPQRFNIVTVQVRGPVAPLPARNFLTNASCGLCGKASLEDLGQRCPAVAAASPVAGSVVAALPSSLGEGQRVFATTGGLHGAALVDSQGKVIAVREDVGRHNAVDKIVGHAVLEELAPLHGHLLGVSGRVSFEIVEKAAVAGIGLIGAVSAPSSLAVDAAERFGLTLVGFIRDGRYNIYAHPERIDLSR